MRKERRHTDTAITADWKDVIEEILTQEVPKHAQAIADEVSGAYVVVRAPITLFVRFRREGDALAANAEVDCACFATDDICVCYGACPEDACDDIPPFTKGLE